jgi:hypothetical protein
MHAKRRNFCERDLFLSFRQMAGQMTNRPKIRSLVNIDPCGVAFRLINAVDKLINK